jgi:hypothetical protein
MRHLVPLLVLLALALAPSGAAANEFDQYEVLNPAASLSDYQAGAHADFTTEFALKTEFPSGEVAQTRDVVVKLPPGLIGNPTAIPTCTLAQLAAFECPLQSQVGLTEYSLRSSGTTPAAVYNMPAPGGDFVARFGFKAGFTFPVTINVRLRPDDYGVTASVEGIPSAVALTGARTTIWGVPASPAHDLERMFEEEGELPTTPRSLDLPPVPFLTNPTRCGAPLAVTIASDSYQLPGAFSSKDAPLPSLLGCGSLEFSPTVQLKPTTSQGASGAGLDYELNLPTKGFELPNVDYGSELKRDEVILPEGMTLNPSEAEGLGVCTEADLARETYGSGPNVGCPETSKIGSAIATSPAVDRPAEGSLFLAKPYENPFDSLVALYMVLKIPDRGVLVKLAGKVEPDPRTGQLITTFDDAPQLPVASFHLHFREGARAPLITPRVCGSYEAVSKLTPWASPSSQLSKASAFAIESGPDHGPCPSGGTPPFAPGFTAGTENNAAGSFSPFYMRLTRKDGDQDLTKFSAALPPGVAGILAGISQCSDAAIAQARSRTGKNGGHEELASPSCPASSQIGHVLGGAGVGSVLTYVEGKVFLAGPYKGAPLSVVAIVPAVAGPFDVGTVVTRQALRINPRTAEVEVDGESSDPIPHILAGIPLSVRDIRVYVDRKDFTFNPTSCEPFATAATLWGGGLDVFGTSDDFPLGVSDRFQAADCAALGFKPNLALRLKGGSKRGGHPALTGVYKPRQGDANLKDLVLRLPHSAFLDQAHIRTICTRVQFAANGGNGGGCPPGSVYGHAKVWTPILSEPLEGPVVLRSSSHNLPDFVAALHGLVDVEAVARIDSVGGGIRATFSRLPDAPITKVVVDMQGQKKGLIINSTNLCAASHRANAEFDAHNAKRFAAKPVMRPSCDGKHKRHKRARRH